jgi:tripartite-type tricarboxylate transporter receptor subunit TctC
MAQGAVMPFPSSIDRRSLLVGTAALAATPLHAQSFPNRQMQLVVPFAAGGAADIIGRTVTDRLTQLYGRQVVVENRPGAGSNTGIASAAKAEPDGHTFALASVALAVNPSLYRAMPFDPVRDLAPLTLALETPNIVIVPKDSAVRSVADLVAAAKAKPKAITYASAGVGSSLHLAAELFKQKAGVDLTHVPYRGSSPALTDLIGGRIDVMFDNASTAMPQIEGGMVRAIGVTTAKRIASLPDVPTVSEQGIADYALANWWAFVAPARTPAAIIERLSTDIRAALTHESSRKNFVAISATTLATTPDELRRHLAVEIERWKDIVGKAGIEPI